MKIDPKTTFKTLLSLNVLLLLLLFMLGTSIKQKIDRAHKTRKETAVIQRQSENLLIQIKKEVDPLSDSFKKMKAGLVPKKDTVEWFIRRLDELSLNSGISFDYEMRGKTVPFGMDRPRAARPEWAFAQPVLAPSTLQLNFTASSFQVTQFLKFIKEDISTAVLVSISLSPETPSSGLDQLKGEATLAFPSFLYSQEAEEIIAFLNE